MQTNFTTLQVVTRSRIGKLSLLFCGELFLLALIYQFFADIECYKLEAATACTFLRSLMARAIILMAVSIVMIWAWPAAFSQFFTAAAAHTAVSGAKVVHFLGVALLFLPLGLTFWGDLGSMFGIAFWPWMIGALAAGVGGLLWMAPAAAWRRLLAQDGFAMVPILLVAVILPDLTEQLRVIWDWSVMTNLTFGAVGWVLERMSSEVYIDPSVYQIGVNSAQGGFLVHVGNPCSGMEGFALVSAFVTMYGFVFRRDLRFPLYFIVVLPIGLLMSWVLNVMRIAILIQIGAHISPDLAVNGFHSYAGWLFFTLLALGLVGLVEVTPWLHKEGRVPKAAMPLRRDPIAASLLPFVAFMVVSTVLSAALIEPELGYPIKVMVMLASLILFIPALRQLPFDWDLPALAVGAAVGIAWLLAAGPPDAGLAAALAGLTPGMLILWVVLRVVGTGILVPIIEEMFFRGYLLTRLNGPGLWRQGFAIVASSLAFAAMHGRWIEAGLAGILFAAVMLRRGRVTDAIQAHVAANLIVAAAALVQGDFSLI